MVYFCFSSNALWVESGWIGENGELEDVYTALVPHPSEFSAAVSDELDAFFGED